MSVRRPVREADHSFPESANIKNDWSYVYSHIHVNSVWREILINYDEGCLQLQQ
jgi:hypothetical protein